MADPLAAADRSSLAAERGSVNMAVAGVLILERGPGVSYEALRRRIEERIHLLPRYRQRLREATLGLANPVWVDDQHFDLDWHIRTATLPPPGDDRQLAAFVAREASRLMDRSRPLWELHVIDGLAGDRVAVMPKMHHALVDGMAAVGVGMILLDQGPEPLPVEPAAHTWQPQPYALSRHLARLAATPIERAQRIALETAQTVLSGSPPVAPADVRRATELVAALAGSRPSAPKLPINGTLSPNRSYGLTRAPLAPVKAAGKAAGGTVNDAILAAVSGMLARYLREAGIEPASLPRDPVALVPVSVRGEHDTGLGNRISIVFVDLPVGEADPGRRIALLSERMTAIKGSAKVAAGAMLVDMTGFAPPLLASILALAPGRDGAFNLVVSNVPGPQLPLYVSGSRVLAVHPVVPLNPADQLLNVGIFSYDGQICFGLTADRALTPGVEAAVAALEGAIDELVG